MSASENLKVTLMEMGFDEALIDRALVSAKRSELSDLVDWIVSHENEKAPVSLNEPNPGPSTSTASDSNSLQADSNTVSMKCDDCGKTFPSAEMASGHASRVGHLNFSESTEGSKVFTPEEAKQRQKELYEKLKELKERREQEERAKAIELEKARRKGGQELTTARERLQEQEMRKWIKEKKQDKLDATRARKRVLEQIKLDRQAVSIMNRANKGGSTNNSADKHLPAATGPPQRRTDSDTCAIQVRSSDGVVLREKFGADDKLQKIYDDVAALSLIGGDFALYSTYPRRLFTEVDKQKSLRDLGLVPSASLFVSKKFEET